MGNCDNHYLFDQSQKNELIIFCYLKRNINLYKSYSQLMVILHWGYISYKYFQGNLFYNFHIIRN